MKMIVGLGNPGRSYKNTRHNTGFMVIDALCEKCGVTLNKEKFDAKYTIATINGNQVIIVEPQTYMNNSGSAVYGLVNYYNVDVADILVIYDDLDLPIGKLRIRPKGSSGGHNGIKDIIRYLNTDQFKRIRVGISNNKEIDTKDYVLGKIAKEDQEEFKKSIALARDAAIDFVDHDISYLMNNYN